MDPAVLAQVLRPLRDLFDPADHPEVLVGLARPDDAAVYRLSADQALIQTLDFFTPVVDDPYTFGAIAAVNSMSDVWAMGGEVIMALNIAGFPASVPPEVISEVFRGGALKVKEAGAVVVGGHTVEAREPMYGLSVTGLVHPDHIVTKGGARPGDRLILTKPLGVGVITTALKQDRAEEGHVDAAVAGMLSANQGAARAMQQVGVHGATDVTGFSLLGHSSEMAMGAGVDLVFRASEIPFLPGAEQYARAGVFPGGTYRNEKHFGPRVTFAPSVREKMRLLLFSPETSGGLLIAVSEDRLTALVRALALTQHPWWEVGRVEPGTGVVHVLD
jgi:selenide, water dikinase